MADYYCEYYYTFGMWEFIGGNTQSGYYCPADPQSHPPGTEGDRYRENPSPINQVSVDYPDQDYYVEYEYRNGQFYLKQANCPEGFCAPADPMEFAKETGTIRVFPVRMAKNRASKGGPTDKGGQSSELA